MTRAVLPLMIVALGCAVAPPPPRVAPRDALSGALEALDQGDFAEAAERAHAGAADDSPEGRRLVLIQALLALDPRNPARTPERGAELAARYLSTARDADETALGMFLYALAIDLGATPDTTGGLPHLPTRTLAARLQELERAVTRLRTELARIQETLKP